MLVSEMKCLQYLDLMYSLLSLFSNMTIHTVAIGRVDASINTTSFILRKTLAQMFSVFLHVEGFPFRTGVPTNSTVDTN